MIFPFKKGIAILGASLIFGGGVDVVQFNEKPILTRDVAVASEQVHIEQKGSIVETTMPWKGEKGLTIKYDYGTPTLKERLVDSRDKEVIAEKVPFNNGEGFKIDIMLKEKPATNTFCYDLEGWEDYDFLYQPALTQAEMDGKPFKNQRPPEIVGSYAIYHKTLKNHQTGGVNYETGKFGHIPFPYVWEVGKEESKMRAEDLTYNAGRLCVVVSQKFLDNADYSNGVRIDPTFGYTSVGASNIEVSSGLTIWIRSYGTPASNGSLTSESTYGQLRYSTTPTFNPSLYSNDADNTPLTRLAYLNSGGTAFSGTAGWVTTNLAYASIVSGTQYWLGLLSTGSSQYWGAYYDAGTTNDVRYVAGTTWPATANDTTALSYRVSIYGTYTADAGGAVNVGTSSVYDE